MNKFRVVKVSIQGIGDKYAPQYKLKETIISKRKYRLAEILLPDKWDVFISWKNFHMIVEGTDEWIPCYYDTKEEAWKRIDTHKNNLILNRKEYTIIEEHYE